MKGFAVETYVVPAALLASVGDTVSNVVATAGIVNGAAPLIAAPLPAGTDEASVLATANAAVHSANFLAVAAAAFAGMAHYAGTIGLVEGAYETVDAANGTQFV
jgi:hypothetical protein